MSKTRVVELVLPPVGGSKADTASREPPPRITRSAKNGGESAKSAQSVHAVWYGGPAQSRFHSQTSPAKSSWPQSPSPREAVPTEAMLARPVQLGLGPPSVAYPDPFAW
jgi:hypothetical protein